MPVLSTCTCDHTTKVDMPTQEEYNRAKVSLALSYCPVIRPCKHCGWPVVNGYCCTTCGSPDPSGNCGD